MLHRLLLLLICWPVNAQLLKVAVMDSGVRPALSVNYCKGEAKSFIDDNIRDFSGHGTNVSYLINANLDHLPYCQVILKIWKPGIHNGKAYMAALDYLTTRNDIKIVNLSISGEGFSYPEKLLIQRLLDQGKILIVAAGNDNKNLDEKCDAYPACYDKRIVVVANGEKGKPLSGSNYGKVVDFYINGVNKGPNVLKLTGSSQSTAILTNKTIKSILKTN